MTSINCTIVGLAALALFGCVGMAQARTTQLSPSSATQMAAVQGLPDARVLFEFDEDSARPGDGEKLDAAYLVWTVSGLSPEATSSFGLYVPTAEQRGGGAGQRVLEAEARQTWDIEPQEYQRSGGLVRIDITELVSGWLGGGSNLGVALGTTSLSGQSFAGQVSNARLVVHFVPDLDN